MHPSVLEDEDDHDGGSNYDDQIWQHMGSNKPEEMCILRYMMIQSTNHHLLILILHIRKPIFNNTEIPVPHCTETYPAQTLVGEVCNVNEVI